jgi:predicted negative regulator of RcsB-dependent stress response
MPPRRRQGAGRSPVSNSQLNLERTPRRAEGARGSINVALSFRICAAGSVLFASINGGSERGVMRRSTSNRRVRVAAKSSFAFNGVISTRTICKPKVQADELVALADEKGTPYWKAAGKVLQGQVLALTGKASDAVQTITSALTAYRSTGATGVLPFYLSYLATAYAELGQFDEAWRCICEAMTAVEATKERVWEAEVHRIAGEIALRSPEPDAAKAEGYFERAISVARQQQAKSWELRAAMSMARLWRDQGKRDEAHDLLAPVYGWFTEGFDTLDLKEAKALLDDLAA